MKIRTAVLVLTLAIVSGSVGFALGQRSIAVSFRNWKPAIVTNKSSALPGKTGEVDFSMFWKVWDTVSGLYVDKAMLVPQKMVDGAISGMVAAIGDPYTVYLPKQENKETKEELGGAFGGVGMELGFKNSQLSVVAPLDGTPAFRAGIKAGDFILRITDEKNKVDRTTDGMSVQEAVRLIRGDIGTKVTLTFFREGSKEPFDITLTREEIVVKSLTLEFKETAGNKKIAVIRLSRFGDKTREEWNNAVNQIIGDKEIKGLVLDLRNNPGGYLETAVYIAGEFVKIGQNVVSEQMGDGKKLDNKTDRNGRLTTMPLVILVNKGSASAAEILAGALQDYRKGKVVGEQSFGKGSVQQPEDFADGSGIHVTIAKWLRPSGDWIDKKGITPDIVLKYEEDPSDSARDNQMDKALDLLK